jgi:AhpD family alkylhydroperoxidase
VTLTKGEALLSLGIAATVGCDSCIEHHVDDAVSVGAERDEIERTIGLARRLGGLRSAECCDEAIAALADSHLDDRYEVVGVPV